MATDTTLVRVEATSFTWDVKGLGWTRRLHKPIFDPDHTDRRTGTAIKLCTRGGSTGEYVSSGNAGAIANAAKHLLGTDALQRERIYSDLRIYYVRDDPQARAFVDIALWDLAGKVAGMPVSKMLGGYKARLPVYAATVDGAEKGFLSQINEFADWAEQVRDYGVKGFKIHPYPWPDIESHVQVVRAVGERVGRSMDLMMDPYCHYRTLADAVKVGKACDEMGYFWYEDPYSDGGVTPFSHKKLREIIRTPLLIGEKVMTLQERMAMVLAKATDFVRGDAPIDGITGTLKLAYAAESVGVDIELHGQGPAHRHLMSAIRNTNYYEIAWTHPEVPCYDPPVYLCGYSDAFPACVGQDGCVPVPEGPGLGVRYDWDYIEKHRTGKVAYDL